MIYPKSREDWLALRRKYVSSTESAALFGMSPYTTAFELATLKTRPELDDFEGNERTEWGQALQLAVAKKIAADYGVKVRAVNGYATNDEARMGASFDYEIIGPNEDASVQDDLLRKMFTEHGRGTLEIKNVDSLVYRNEWDDGEPPAHIEIQVQHQMECNDHAWAAIGVLVGGNRCHVIIRMRDTDVGQAIAFKSIEFMAGLDRGVMPPVSLPEDADIIRKIYNSAEPDKVYDASKDEEVKALLAEYIKISFTRKNAEACLDTVRSHLLLKIKDAERVLCPGFSVSTGVVSETFVPAHTRKAYRNVRITAKKEGKK